MSTPDGHPRTPLVEARDVHKIYDTGKVQGARAERRRPRDRPRRDGRDHGAERLRQDDAPQLPLRPRRRRRRATSLIDGTSLASMSRPRAHRLPRAPHGLRLPVLQPDAGAERGRERRAAAAGRAPLAAGGARAGARGARPRRPRRPGPPRPGRALRRRAPARHDRARARQRPGDRLGRRADRRPRQRERRRDRRR